MDNASNNNTLVEYLSELLSPRGIEFSEVDNRIRSVLAFIIGSETLNCLLDQLLSACYQPGFKSGACGYHRPDPCCHSWRWNGPRQRSCCYWALSWCNRSCANDYPSGMYSVDIALTELFILSQIRASSLKRDRFADIQRARNPKKEPLQLLRDVDTRWSSTLLMIERFVELKEVN